MPPSKRGSKRQAAGDYETPHSSHQKLQDDNDKSLSTSPEISETGNGNGTRSGNDAPERFSFVAPAPSHRTTEIYRYSPTE